MLVQNLDKSDVVLTTDSLSLCYRNRVCVFIESQREMTLLVFSATVTMSIEKKKPKKQMMRGKVVLYNPM